MGCDGDRGVGVHFPTVILLLWAGFLSPVHQHLALGMRLLKLSLEFKMPQSCWHTPASCGTCVTPAGCWYHFSFHRILALRQNTNYIIQNTLSAKYTTGAGQERGGCSGGRGCCHERSHFFTFFSVSFALPQFTSCAGEKG